jgi:hypothetical protein
MMHHCELKKKESFCIYYTQLLPVDPEQVKVCWTYQSDARCSMFSIYLCFGLAATVHFLSCNPLTFQLY